MTKMKSKFTTTKATKDRGSHSSAGAPEALAEVVTVVHTTKKIYVRITTNV